MAEDAPRHYKHDDDQPVWRLPYLDCYNRLLDRGLPRYVVEERLDPLFQSVWWRDASLKPAERDRGYVDHIGFRYWRWGHRPIHTLGVDMRAFEFAQDNLRSAVADYIKDARVQDPFLDWYCADVLAYMEWYATVEQLSGLLFGIIGSLSMQFGWGWQLAAGLWRLIWRGTKWIVWLGILIAIYQMLDAPANQAGVAALMAVTVVLQVRRYKARSKLTQMWNEMRRAYDVFQTETFSWEVAWLELNRTRELGVVWPGELYALVEARKQYPAYVPPGERKGDSTARGP